MKSSFSEEELWQRVKQAVVTINKEDAMHCAPIHSAAEILARKKTDDLHLLARGTAEDRPDGRDSDRGRLRLCHRRIENRSAFREPDRGIRKNGAE
ncbi:hypothetical protein GX865_05520 [Candidatus Saccharibacteria bacterium]|nr:hypothetical protein [Candidatus Saccharibacteria bacterium]